jgi:hypothetical protein
MMAAFVPSFASFASARRRVRARREGDDPSDSSRSESGEKAHRQLARRKIFCGFF